MERLFVSFVRVFTRGKTLFRLNLKKISNAKPMGSLLSRIFEGPVPDNDFEVKEYQKSLKRRGRICLGLVTSFCIVVGFKLSGSVLIALGIGITPAFILWKGHNAAWKEIQPEFVTDEWNSCVQSIHTTIETLRRRHHERYVFKYPIFINLPLLAVYHIHHRSFAYQIKQSHMSESTESFKDALHYMKFASSAYGAVYMRFLRIIKELPIMAEEGIDAGAISRHTGISASDIHAMELEGVQVNCPAFFVAVDHRKKAVVVTVRGTSNIADVMTDLVCKSVKFLDGIAHEGIKIGAEKLFKKTIELVSSLLSSHKGYSLVFTGHSLGAGTSILLTMLYLEFQKKQGDSERCLIGNELLESSKNMVIAQDVDIHCYAFAPPPVFAPKEMHNMADLQEKIDVYINHCDIVPRLSLASFNDMLHALQKVDSLKLNLKERIAVFFFAASHPIMSRIIDMIRSVIEDINFRQLQAEDESHFERIFIPGQIHLMQKTQEENEYVVCRKNNNFFTHMLLVEGFFADHLPDKYENAITSVYESNKRK
eukprot:gene3386-3876_t